MAVARIWDADNGVWQTIGEGQAHVVDTTEPSNPTDGMLWTNPSETPTELLASQFEVVGYTEVASIALTSTTASPIGTIVLAIPATWLTWRCETHWSLSRQLENNAGVGGYVVYDVLTAGVASQGQAVTRFMNLAGNAYVMESGQGHRSGITATGNQTISVRGLVDAGTVAMQDLNMYTRAVRMT